MSRQATVSKPLFLAATLICSLSATLAAHAADWSDTSISYRYIAKESAFVTDANNNKIDVAKQIVSLTHIDGYKYGTNFFNIDVLKSNSNNPANNGAGGFGNLPGTATGAEEVFAIYRHDLSLSVVSGSSLKKGIVKDVTLTTGFNLGAKNDFNAAAPMALLLGPTVQFALPAGFLNVGLQAYKESNNSAISNAIFSQGSHQQFKTAPQLNAVWGIPFNAVVVPANFKGFLSVTGPKGRGTSNGDATKTETLMDAMVMFDLGALSGKKDVFLAGIGYRYWNNKFGNDETLNANNKAGHISAPFVQVEAHF